MLILLEVFGPFHFHLNFKVGLPITTNETGFLIEIVLNFTEQNEKLTLYNTKSIIQEHGLSLHLGILIFSLVI